MLYILREKEIDNKQVLLKGKKIEELMLYFGYFFIAGFHSVHSKNHMVIYP